ncbi:F0F1 ATP synthase subunit delta [Candidatus Parcubacteria bacterium]|nr:F0F1 ATP synthase subunit delta [Candidatus Parcubacteria bacterium]
MKYSDRQLATALLETAEHAHNARGAADALMAWLSQRGELHRARGVAAAVEQVWKQKYGAATVTIASAHALPSDLKKRLETLAPGAEVKEAVDPALIGGARVRVDDRVVDGTIAGYLEQLRATLAL